MVMKYPTATARLKGRPNVPGSRGPFKQRPILITPKRIPGVTLPRPPVARSLAKRVIPKLIPGLGAALTVYEVYQIYRAGTAADGVVNSEYWQLSRSCRGWDGNYYYDYARSTPCADFVLTQTANIGAGGTNLYHGGPNSPSGLGAFTLMNHAGNVSYYTYANVAEVWVRRLTAPNPAPIWAPVSVPVIIPVTVPGGYPLSPAVGTPKPKSWPDAVARPGEQPSADENPAQRPGQGKKPADRTIWEIPPLPVPITIVPNVSPNPGPDDFPVPSPNVQEAVIPRQGYGARTRVQTRSNSNQARNRKPNRREKERKLNVRTVAGAGWAIINLFTEGLDFLDVLHNALPKKNRAKGYNPYDKAAAVYEHLDKIDIALAVENFINNQIEDYIYGTMGKATSKAQKTIGSPTGLSRALRQNQSQFMEETGMEVELPEVHYDREAGEIYLTGFGFSSR